MVDNGETPKVEPRPESSIMEGDQRAHQLGGSNAEPNLVQNRSIQLDPSRTDLRTGSKTDLRTGSKTYLEPVLPYTQERLKSVSIDSIIPQP